jgi:hypothetical protein
VSRPKPDYNTTLARIAGNIAAGMVAHENYTYGSRLGLPNEIAALSVDLARRIVAEVRATERATEPKETPSE